MIDFDAVRLQRLRKRAETLGLGLVALDSEPVLYALLGHDRQLNLVDAATGSQPDARRLTLTEVATKLSDIESRLQPV